MFFCHRGSDSPPNVRILAEQTHTVGAVVEKLGMSQPTISKHLKVLRDADVVSRDRGGATSPLLLNPDVFATVTEWINETVQIARRPAKRTCRGTARWRDCICLE